jgi:hypothetical protein
MSIRPGSILSMTVEKKPSTHAIHIWVTPLFHDFSTIASATKHEAAKEIETFADNEFLSIPLFRLNIGLDAHIAFFEACSTLISYFNLRAR